MWIRHLHKRKAFSTSAQEHSAWLVENVNRDPTLRPWACVLPKKKLHGPKPLNIKTKLKIVLIGEVEGIQ